MPNIPGVPHKNFKVPDKLSFSSSLPLTTEDKKHLKAWIDFLKLTEIASKLKEVINNKISIYAQTYPENLVFFDNNTQKIFSTTDKDDLVWWLEQGKILWVKIMFHAQSNPKEECISFLFNFFIENRAEVGVSLECKEKVDGSLAAFILKFMKSQITDLPVKKVNLKLNWETAGEMFHSVIKSINKL